MMSEGLVFAVAAAIVFGLWTIFHQQASKSVDSLFGAIVVSLTAVILGLIFLLPKIKSTILYSNPKGIVFAVLAGVSALLLDLFVLKSYSTGFPISVGAPIVIGGSIAFAAVIGFFLGESVTLAKVSGLVLVIIGSAILAAFSK